MGHLAAVGVDQVLDAGKADWIAGGQAKLVGEEAPAAIVEGQLQAEPQVEQRRVRGSEADTGHRRLNAADDAIVPRLRQRDAPVGQCRDDGPVVEELDILQAASHGPGNGIQELGRRAGVQAHAKIGLLSVDPAHRLHCEVGDGVRGIAPLGIGSAHDGVGKGRHPRKGQAHVGVKEGDRVARLDVEALQQLQRLLLGQATGLSIRTVEGP